MTPRDGTTERLRIGMRLLNDLRDADSAFAAQDTIDALDAEQLRAVTLAGVAEWRQLADDASTYSDWWKRDG